MKKEFLENLKGKNNIQVAMSLLQKRLRTYTKVSYSHLKKSYLLYNFWLKVDVNLSEREYQYVSEKLGI